MLSFDMIKSENALVMLKDLKEGKIGHAYLIVSEDGEARKALFFKFALSVFCKTSCGECPSCKQILSGNHIGIKIFDGKDRMKVKDATDITNDTRILPILGDRKLYFIDNAHLLDPRVQNKLLKTLEEPPSYVTIVLASCNESGLLSTIRSRSKAIYIEPFTSKEIYQELMESGIDNSIAEAAAVYSMGNYEKALLFSSDSVYKEIYEDTFQMLIKLKNSSQIAEFMYKDIFSKEKINYTLDVLEIFLSDILKISAKSGLDKHTLNKDYDLNNISKGFTPSAVSEALNSINQGRKMLKFNVNALSVAEKILFDLLEAKYKWQ